MAIGIFVEYPDLVFSKPAYLGSPNHSSSGYWGSNAAAGGVYNGQPIIQQPNLDATTSGGRSDLLTADTGTFIHADSLAFRNLMASQVDPTQNDYAIYSASFYQDEPLVLPAFPEMASGELHTFVNVTMRSTGTPSPKIAFAQLLNFDPSVGETPDLTLSEPDYQPIIGPTWETYTFDFRYDVDGFRSWPLVDGQLVGDILRLFDSLAAGKVHLDLTVNTTAAYVPGQTPDTWGQLDIAHVVLSSVLVYEPVTDTSTTISTKGVHSRRAFGRAS